MCLLDERDLWRVKTRISTSHLENLFMRAATETTRETRPFDTRTQQTFALKEKVALRPLYCPENKRARDGLMRNDADAFQSKKNESIHSVQQARNNLLTRLGDVTFHLHPLVCRHWCGCRDRVLAGSAVMMMWRMMQVGRKMVEMVRAV